MRALILLSVMVLQFELPGVDVRAEETLRGTLSSRVIGTERVAPGDPVEFLVTIGGRIPRTVVTIYVQLGSGLAFVRDPLSTPPDFEQRCIIVALPVENLPGADPAAPAENRVACAVQTDDRGGARLILGARMARRHAFGPTNDATTRSVAAIEDLPTEAIGATASAQVELWVEPR